MNRDTDPVKVADRPVGERPEVGPTRRLAAPAGARCERCGSAEASSMPYFAAGSGLAFRPVADDIQCHRCGYIGRPDFA